MEEEFPLPQKPLPISYSLFEDKTYLEILRDRLQKKVIEVYEETIEKINSYMKDTIMKLKFALGDLYEKIYEIKGQKADSSFLKNLALMEIEEVEKKLKEIPLSDKEYEKLKEEAPELLVYIKNLHQEWMELQQAKERIMMEKEKVKAQETVFQKLIDLLELYPKHLRLGNLDIFEVKAMRFITDSYFTLFGRGLIFGRLSDIEKANFIVLPFILNIQETSLSKEAFFLRLIHGSPLTPTGIPEGEEPEEEIVKGDALSKALGEIKSNDERDIKNLFKKK